MTDLERAAREFITSQGYYFGRHQNDVVQLLVEFATAARREGAESAARVDKEMLLQVARIAAEEMRERAAQRMQQMDEPICAAAIRALPLTPETDA